jgi:DeoR family transcriptional regulator, fructose operon transcriptional repressor
MNWPTISASPTTPFVGISRTLNDVSCFCTHGGAVSTALLVHRETPFLTRANAHADAKTGIGRAAVQLISDGETLIINAGSTTSAFAASLGARRSLGYSRQNVYAAP